MAGYVGEISLFADNQLRENHVWADGSTINPATWPDLAAYAATAGWETDSGTGWYKTPNLQGCFLLPSSAEYAVNTTGGEATHTLTEQEMPAHTHAFQNPMLAFTSNPPSGKSTVQLSGTSSGVGWMGTDAIGEQSTASTGSGQSHNNMPPYYVVTAQIRAKVDIIEATAVEVNGNTLGGFEDGQVLAQQGGKIVGQTMAQSLFNLGKLLWTGNFSSGSITVPNISNYQIVAVILQNDICCIGTNQWGIGGFAEYGSYTNKVCGYRLSPYGNTLTIDENCKGGNVDNQQVPIIRIYGIC